MMLLSAPLANRTRHKFVTESYKNASDTWVRFYFIPIPLYTVSISVWSEPVHSCVPYFVSLFHGTWSGSGHSPACAYLNTWGLQNYYLILIRYWRCPNQNGSNSGLASALARAIAFECVAAPSERAKRLNILGMIDRGNRFEGFCTSDSINAQKVVDFLEQYCFRVNKKTFIVLDNASVHRNAKIRQMRLIWEKRGLFLFYIPPYCPHLNIVETLWKVTEGKWLRSQDYTCADTLFYVTNRALAAIGADLKINYAHYAA